MVLRISVVFVCLILISSCKRNFLKPKELFEYIENPKNGLCQIININENTNIRVLYQPSDIITYNEFSENQYVNSVKQYDKVIKYNKNIYFKMMMATSNKEMLSYNTNSLKEVSDRIMTLSFNVNDYVYIITDKRDTILPSAYFSDRTFGMNNSTNVTLVFPRKELMNKTDNKFKMNIDEMGFNIGNRFVIFEKSNIENCPKIKL